MLLLTSTSDKIQVITGSASAVKVHASWVDHASGTITPGRTNTASITTATTTDIVAAPGASTQRNVKHLIARNDHASQSNDTTIQHTDATNVAILWRGVLLAGETVYYEDGAGWFVTTSNGLIKPSTPKLNVFLRVSGSDVVNSNGSVWADITGLTWPVENAKNYGFVAHLAHLSAAATTGAWFGINGPISSSLITTLSSTVISTTNASPATGLTTALNTSAAGATTSGPATTGGMTILSGTFLTNADGTFAMRFETEVNTSAVTVKVGSLLHLFETDN